MTVLEFWYSRSWRSVVNKETDLYYGAAMLIFLSFIKKNKCNQCNQIKARRKNSLFPSTSGQSCITTVMGLLETRQKW